MKKDTILLDHGSGGLATQKLVQDLFLPHLDNPALRELEDSAIISVPGERLAFTTDSYVVDPIFFPGGDIGHLAVNGTLNDLAMRGARPVCLSLGLILEEGLPMADLERILRSIGEASREAEVPVVAGDTKVVDRGKADGIFINTSGVGLVPDGQTLGSASVRPGDCILLSGTVADHGVTILTRRAGLSVEADIASDTQALHRLVAALLAEAPAAVRALRDPTRGGLATSLCEIAERAGVGMEIDEDQIPVRPAVAGACEMLGLDPLYLANEGKCIAVVAAEAAERLLAAMKARPEAPHAALIGRVTDGSPGRVTLKTAVGGRRIIQPLSGEPLPRIC